MPHARILRATRRVIRRCGWLGSDALGNCANLSLPGAPTITYGKTNRVRVPRQVIPDSCGIHTILNAWILLLGLPGIQHRARYSTTALHKEEENDELVFMKQALEVLNLVLGGWMDARTTQAFLCGFGFVECIAGPPGVEEEAGWVDDVGMARMTAGLLQSVLDEARDETMSLFLMVGCLARGFFGTWVLWSLGIRSLYCIAKEEDVPSWILLRVHTF